MSNERVSSEPPEAFMVRSAALGALGVNLLYWGDRAWGIAGTVGIYASPEQAIFWAAWQMGANGIEPAEGSFWCKMADGGPHNPSADGTYCLTCGGNVLAEDEEGGKR